MQIQSSRFAIVCLTAAFTFLGALAFAGSSEAIFFPCSKSCENGAGANAKCSYYQRDGNCLAFPNPCYMTCATYWSCTGSPQPLTETSALESEAVSDAEYAIAFGEDFGSWLETVALRYGPCLEIATDEAPGKLMKAVPVRQLAAGSDDEISADVKR